jgi:hypothetical protein
LASTRREGFDLDGRSEVSRFGGDKQVLEDGPDKCSSESDSENSDHGEMWTYESMYMPEMLGPDGKPKKGGPQVLLESQAFALRAAAHCTASSSSSGPTRPGTPSTPTTEGEDSVHE